nr:alpha/beta hydrolase [Mangrovicoccus ximenensis]
MIRIEESDALRVLARDPPDSGQKRILLSFTGIGNQMGGMQVQEPEFFTAGNAFDNIFFISDLMRSWGNAYDFAALCDRLGPHLAGREVCALGNSMGGFLAILAAAHLDIEAVAAFVPQFSVAPHVVPEETRWREHVGAIRDWRVPSLDGRFNRRTRYHVFSGNTGEERVHSRLFPVQPNLFHAVPRRSGHRLAKKLKERGVLRDVISAAWEGSLTGPRLARMAGCAVEMLSGGSPARPSCVGAGWSTPPGRHCPASRPSRSKSPQSRVSTSCITSPKTWSLSTRVRRASSVARSSAITGSASSSARNSGVGMCSSRQSVSAWTVSERGS